MSVDGVSDVLRFSGISSGLDTEAIIESLTQIDQMKVDSAEQDKIRLEYKAEQLREVNLTLKTFDDKYNSLLSETSMVSSSTYNSYSVSLGGNTSAASIVAGSSSSIGSMQIDSISQLAEVASVESTNLFDTDSESVLTSTLGDLSFTGTALAFDYTDNEDGEIAFSINGVDFTFESDDSVKNMISEINSSGAGVYMSYSSLKDGFKLTSTTTGSDQTIEIINTKGNAFAANAADAAFGIASDTTYAGLDAQLTIEGIAVTKSSNSFAIDGISYTLNETSAEAITFNVSRDVDSTVDAVMSYIDDYNTLIETLNSKIDEEYYRNYPPLTDDQKEEMSESEIESWEEYSQSGLLKNDFSISNTLSSMRSAFYESVGGTGLSPFNIGLTTSSNYLDNGKIVVDEDKLRQAIIDNPTAVQEIFTGLPDDDSTDERADSGLIYRIGDAISNHISNTKENEIASTDSSIDRAEDRVDELIERMEANREIQWAKFNALEASLTQMNNQWSALASQLGMGSASS